MLDISEIPEDKISAVHSLEGKVLSNGWLVTKMFKPKPGSTGSNFSICYLVEKGDKKGFLKALNILTFLTGEKSDLLEATTEALNNFKFEKNLMEKCSKNNCSKVSRLLDSGNEVIPGYIISNIYYLIFERANGDVRAHINFSESVDIAWKLRSLHNIAVGVKQLHNIGIGHQDVKPSNIFIFKNKASKIGDLGRSLSKDFEAAHSKSKFSGDYRYAPPEVFHGYHLSEWDDRIKSIDCYLLGSMITYYFTGQNMTALLSQKVNPNINIYELNFDAALPYWIEAFEESLNEVEDALFNFSHKSEVVSLVRILCYPDPIKRGFRKNIIGKKNNFSLERVITKLNLLANKAEFKVVE